MSAASSLAGRRGHRPRRDRAGRAAPCRGGGAGRSRRAAHAARRSTPRSNRAPMSASAARPAPTASPPPASPGSSPRSRIPTRAPPGRASSACARPGSKSPSARARTKRSDSLAGYLTRLGLGRPRITLKLALSIDGKIALPSGESKWITGEDARAHVHLERARSDMILVGRGTYLADRPSLDVRLPGLEDRSPRRALLTRGEAVDGWETLSSPQDVYRLHDVNDLLVEGGSATATAFLAADLVDRILIYRAPIIVGEGKSSVRLRRPRRHRRRPRPLASGRRPGAWHRPPRSLRARLMFTGIVTDIGTVREAPRATATCASTSPAATTSPRSISARRSPARACA